MARATAKRENVAAAGLRGKSHARTRGECFRPTLGSVPFRTSLPRLSAGRGRKQSPRLRQRLVISGSRGERPRLDSLTQQAGGTPPPAPQRQHFFPFPRGAPDAAFNGQDFENPMQWTAIWTSLYERAPRGAAAGQQRAGAAGCTLQRLVKHPVQQQSALGLYLAESCRDARAPLRVGEPLALSWIHPTCMSTLIADEGSDLRDVETAASTLETCSAAEPFKHGRSAND